MVAPVHFELCFVPVVLQLLLPVVGVIIERVELGRFPDLSRRGLRIHDILMLLSLNVVDPDLVFVLLQMFDFVQQ